MTVGQTELHASGPPWSTPHSSPPAAIIYADWSAWAHAHGGQGTDRGASWGRAGGIGQGL